MTNDMKLYEEYKAKVKVMFKLIEFPVEALSLRKGSRQGLIVFRSGD